MNSSRKQPKSPTTNAYERIRAGSIEQEKTQAPQQQQTEVTTPKSNKRTNGYVWLVVLILAFILIAVVALCIGNWYKRRVSDRPLGYYEMSEQPLVYNQGESFVWYTFVIPHFLYLTILEHVFFLYASLIKLIYLLI